MVWNPQVTTQSCDLEHFEVSICFIRDLTQIIDGKGKQS